MTTTMNAIERETRYSAHNYAPLPVVLARGEGAHLWDTSGRRYVDMMSAYSAASHGHATTVISSSPRPEYRAGFGPFTPGFRAVPFGDLAAIERAITPNTAAVLIEPIQGEAGIVVPPAGFLLALRRLCDAHNVLLI